MNLPANIQIVSDRDIFSTQSQTLVRPSTCNGSLPDDGFKQAYPEMIKAYVTACKLKEVRLGIMWFYREPSTTFSRKTLICFPIRKTRSELTSISILELGLKDLVKTYKDWNIKSLAIPLLARKGISQHSEISMLNLMIAYLKKMSDVKIELYL